MKVFRILLPNTANCYIYSSSNSPSQPGIHTFSNSVFTYSENHNYHVVRSLAGSHQALNVAFEAYSTGAGGEIASSKASAESFVAQFYLHNITTSQVKRPLFRQQTRSTQCPLFRRKIRRQSHSASRRSILHVLHQVVRTPPPSQALQSTPGFYGRLPSQKVLQHLLTIQGWCRWKSTVAYRIKRSLHTHRVSWKVPMIS